MRVRKLLLVFLGMCLLGMTSMASAAVVATGQVAIPGGETATFELPVSMISGSPAFTGGAAPLYTESGFASWDQMADGYVGAANATDCMLLDGITDFPWAVWTFDTVAQPAGYDIGSIQTFAGFNQNRPWQAVEVKYALVGDAIVPGTELGYTLGTYSYQPTGLGSGYNATKMTIADADPVNVTMLSGVSAIQIKFIDNGFSAAVDKSNYTSYREIAVLAPGEVPVTPPIHATGTYVEGVTPPVLPANNLIAQGSATLSSSYAGGAAPASWGAQLPGGMNDGVMTNADALPILAWDGVTGDFGWAVYQLDTSVNTLGYDVSEILSYAGWSGARVNQAVEIKYALVGDTIIEGEELSRTLDSFYYAPSNNATPYAYTTMSITNDEDPLVLSGISAIEVKYIDNRFNGLNGDVVSAGNYSAYKQFAVIGTPTESGVVDIPGDANRDRKVDGSDVTILAGNWQVLQGASWEMGDFNGDGKVDGSDVTILAGNWQAGVNTAAASVPEPSTLVGLLGLCLAGWFALIRRKR